jgi:hypothetical protein
MRSSPSLWALMPCPGDDGPRSWRPRLSHPRPPAAPGLPRAVGSGPPLTTRAATATSARRRARRHARGGHRARRARRRRGQGEGRRRVRHAGDRQAGRPSSPPRRRLSRRATVMPSWSKRRTCDMAGVSNSSLVGPVQRDRRRPPLSRPSTCRAETMGSRCASRPIPGSRVARPRSPAGAPPLGTTGTTADVPVVRTRCTHQAGHRRITDSWHESGVRASSLGITAGQEGSRLWESNP